MMIRILMKEPQGQWSELRVPNRLDTYQALVGGHIETVPGPFPSTVYVVAEEGKLRKERPNVAIDGDVLVGNIVLVGVSGDDFCDCPYPIKDVTAVTEDNFITAEMLG